MSNFVDILNGSWYYNDINDLQELTSIDDEKFFAGYNYNAFEAGKEPIDYRFTYPDSDDTKSIYSETNNSFIINSSIIVTDNNPLLVYVDGILVTIDSIRIDEPAAGKTLVGLVRGVSAGSEVRFKYAGVPSLITDPHNNEREVPGLTGLPLIVPSTDLVITSGYSYKYDPFNTKITEVVKYYGTQLKRVDLIVDGVTGLGLPSQSIKNENEYCIDDTGATTKLCVHYALNNEPIEISFLSEDTQGVQKSEYNFSLIPFTETENMLYTDRFFPDITTTRAEIFTLLNKLRVHLFKRFTIIPEEDLRVDKTESRFPDVQAELDVSEPWWWTHVKDLEDLVISQNKEKHKIIANKIPDNIGTFNLIIDDGLGSFINLNIAVGGNIITIEDVANLIYERVNTAIGSIATVTLDGTSVLIEYNEVGERLEPLYADVDTGLEFTITTEVKGSIYLIVGDENGNLNAYDSITRAELVTLLELFRRWFIEVFK